MGVADREYMKDTEERSALPPSWLQRLNEFGERHARLIIFLSTAVIIITVLIVADALWRRARIERGVHELEQALTVEELEALKAKYGDSAALLPRILYRLGNRHHEEGRLDEAAETYEQFLRTFGDDPLNDEVQKAYATLLQNRDFVSTERQAIMKVGTLQTHPTRRTRLETWPVKFGPVREANPVAVIEIRNNISVRIELLEDESPNTVANFVELCEKKYFDGLKLRKSGDKRLEIEKKGADPVTYLLPFEENAREPEAGVVAMLRTEGGPENLGAEFLILLADDPDLKNHTIFGQLREGGIPALRALNPDDPLITIRIESKRGHEYKATTLPK